jgi:hypothetical protein
MLFLRQAGAVGLVVASGVLNSQALAANAVDVQGYLVACAGAVNVNACATTAALQAQKLALPLRFPAGTYRLSDWSPPCPLQIVGDGQSRTILERPDHSASGIVIAASHCGGLRMSHLTIDGNRANNATTGYSVVLDGNWHTSLEDVEIENSQGPGSALTLQSTADDLKGTHSRLSGLNVHDNDGNGIYLQRHAWNWTIVNSVLRRNQGDGIDVIDYVFPPATKQFSDCAILNNEISHNGANGVSLTSGIDGGTPARPSNGPFNTVQNCKIAGNRVSFNGAYGIIMSGGYRIELASNKTENNGSHKGSEVAGINAALCEQCDIHDNISDHNDFYGIDVGGAVHTRVRHNLVTDNGNPTIGNGNGISCGACRYVSILDNVIRNNGAGAGGPQIHVTTYDGGVSGFALPAQNITIRGNTLACANSRQIGLLVLSDPQNMIIEDNRTHGCAPMLGYVLHTTAAQLHGNQQDDWVDGAALVAAQGAAVFPDAAEVIAVSPHSGHAVTALQPYFYSTHFHTVYAVVVTAGGSGYSQAPTVSFSGGGCNAEPTGFAFQDNAGHVVGVDLRGYGSGCTSAPRVSFADASGSGASATAYVLNSPPITGRVLKVHLPAGVAVENKPDGLGLLGDKSFVVPTGAGYLSTFEGRNNRWIETSRAP